MHERGQPSTPPWKEEEESREVGSLYGGIGALWRPTVHRVSDENEFVRERRGGAVHVQRHEV